MANWVDTIKGITRKKEKKIDSILINIQLYKNCMYKEIVFLYIGVVTIFFYFYEQ